MNTIAPDTHPLYFEEKIAARLGLSRADLKYVRKEHLKKRAHWSIVRKNVVLSQAGLDALMRYLRESSNATIARDIDFRGCSLPQPKKKTPAGRAAPPDDDPELVSLTVVRLYGNNHLLVAREPGAEEAPGNLVNVRVKNNENFLPKMTLRARLVRPGVYQMEGRCPRYRGRY